MDRNQAEEILMYGVSLAKIEIQKNFPVDFCILSDMKIKFHWYEEGEPAIYRTAYTNCIDVIGMNVTFMLEHLNEFSRKDTNKDLSLSNIDKNKNFCLPVLLHEIRHKALKFMHRLNGKDIRLMNCAQDYIINTELYLDGIFPSEMKYCDLPNFINNVNNYNSNKDTSVTSSNIIELLIDPFIDLKEDSTESIYEYLLENIKPPSESSKGGESVVGDGGGGLTGDDIDTSGFGSLSDEEKEDLKEHIQNQIQNGLKMAKSRGVNPGDMYEKLSNVGYVKPSFGTQLLNNLKKHYKTKRTYSRAHRRQLVVNSQIWPAKSKTEHGSLCILVDTSGSCTPFFKYFFKNINGILKYFNFEKVDVIQVDTKVTSHETYKRKQKIREPKVQGLGGTSFQPGFEYIKENKLNPSKIIYLTDGFAPYNFDYPLDALWVVISGGTTPPRGDYIELSLYEAMEHNK